MSKIYNFFKWLYIKMCRYSAYIDSFIVLYVYLKVKDTTKYSFLLLIIFGYFLYRAIKYSYYVWVGKKTIISDSLNSRVQAIEGGNGRGKSSFVFYSCSVLGVPVLSNVPVKIRGDFVYKLKDLHIHELERIPTYSAVVLDECGLVYNNLDKYNHFDFEVLLQLGRHFFDGNFYLSTIKASRLPNQIREKVTLCKMMLGQRVVYQSLITLPILNLFKGVFGFKYPLGLRVWTYQDFEEIDHDNYTFDLSNQDKDTKNNKFSNLVDLYAYSDCCMFEYEDRFMLGLYNELLQKEFEEDKFNSLHYDYETLNELGYSKLNEHFRQRIKYKK